MQILIQSRQGLEKELEKIKNQELWQVFEEMKDLR